jgi:hypothetical protein
MSSLWEFVRQKRNREVIGWLGGGLVVAATGLWAAVVFLFPVQTPKPASAEANCGGVAIVGGVTGTTITGGTTTSSDCASKPK